MPPSGDCRNLGENTFSLVLLLLLLLLSWCLALALALVLSWPNNPNPRSEWPLVPTVRRFDPRVPLDGELNKGMSFVSPPAAFPPASGARVYHSRDEGAWREELAVPCWMGEARASDNSLNTCGL